MPGGFWQCFCAYDLRGVLFKSMGNDKVAAMWTQKVKEFTQACEPVLPEKPKKLSPEKIAFIRAMVNDELNELAQAGTTWEQADALVDAIYYMCDTAVRHGMNLDPLFDIVHQSNLQKIVNGRVLRREDGKILKPETWRDPAPLLAAEMDRQEVEGAFSAS